MPNNESFVFDTSTLISALLFKEGKPGQALHLALKRGVLLISAPVVHEIATVLGRKKFDRYVTTDERALFLNALLREADLVEITETVQACRDPHDDMFLELAVNGGAAYIITSDSDLLTMRTFRGIPILTPDQFLEISKDP